MSEKEPPLLPTLPMHLMLTLGCWLSSPFALRCAKTVLPSLKSAGDQPSQSEALRQAVAGEAKNRASKLLTGILRYVDTPYKRTLAEPSVIWRHGNARLLDYGLKAAADATQPIVLFVPSLINRYYILDLETDRSMMRSLAAQGIYPLLLDWDEPGALEKDFGCGDYVTQTLNAAIDFITTIAHRPVILAGYCMGGILALASAMLKPKQVSALALLATPWDFYCDAFKPFVVDKAWQTTIDSMIASQKMLPADVIQSLFYLTDPWIFEQKFRRFADLQADHPSAHDFIALEHWVNDGVPMTSAVARDCLIGWAQQNVLAHGQWRVGGRIIDPSAVTIPTFIAIPNNDHVVPLDCAMPLAKAMPHAEVMHPGSGHVGMIVGKHARRELWNPLVKWMKKNSV